MLIWATLLHVIIVAALLPLIMASPRVFLALTARISVAQTIAVFVGLIAVVFVVRVLLISEIDLESLPRLKPAKRVPEYSNRNPPELFSGDSDQILPSGYRWQALPDEAPYPADNPPNLQKIALGEKLFNDKNLSKDRTVSCASCHDLQLKMGADGEKVAKGIGGQLGSRNTPTVWNSGFLRALFWDGRSESLEHQAIQPMLNPVEMGMRSEQEIIERLSHRSDYREAFLLAFGDSTISIDAIRKALASYQRTLVTNDSPYDDFVRGDMNALSKQQIQGMALFEKVGCVLCHDGPNFSVASVFSSGLPLRLFPANQTPAIRGLGLMNPETNKPDAWRVPGLRNVALTGPWLHDGSVDQLEDVVRIMAEAQLGKGRDKDVLWSNQRLVIVANPALTDREVSDIVSFLKALSSKRLVELSSDHR